MAKNYQSYDSVPWYRKSRVNHWFAILGLLFFPPLVWWVAILCLTGDIYTPKQDESGNLKKWGAFSKVFSIIIVILQGLFIALQLGLISLS
jgi:hypothetical protein